MRLLSPRFELGRDVKVGRGGRVIVGGQPVRAIRLTPAGIRLVDGALQGTLGEIGRAEKSLIDRLVRAGLLNPLPEPSAGAGERTTVIIPALDEAESIGQLVATVLPTVFEVIVVDDGSTDGTAEAAGSAGARVIRHERSRGPGASRNTASIATGTELIAFLDADCLAPSSDWIERLAGHLNLPGVVLVAPRIVGAGPTECGRSTDLIAEYERDSCPLDMGVRPSVAGRGKSVPFVPSAAMLIDRAALVEAGGFAEELRYGEDVDLVWRLSENGMLCRYEPAVIVKHRSRSGIAAFARQRFHYGASAVALDRRHPGAVAPFHGSLTGFGVALANPYAGLLPVAASSLLGARRLTRAGGPLSGRQGFAIAMGGGLNSVITLNRGLAREWLPFTIAAAFSRRLRRFVLWALVGLVVDEAKRPAATFLPSLALGGIARASYAAGLWSASVKSRRLAPLLPTLGVKRKSVVDQDRPAGLK
ncbi:MAG: mycofactocin biosynthesis glycosyltransferase MftF [Actinomycetota bacterium]|nr:mycofactocin biosynthesis glycosyltransferase MftF [Actinomycetota bacterium]